MKYRKLLAVMFAAAMSVSALSGCSGNDSNDGEGIASESTSSSSSSTDGTKVSGNEVIEGISQALEENEMVTDTRPIEEGDDYAINKITIKLREMFFREVLLCRNIRKKLKARCIPMKSHRSLSVHIIIKKICRIWLYGRIMPVRF